MKARTYNSIAPIIHEKWVANVLGMKKNPNKGPDLIDNKKFLEVKFCLIKPKDNKKEYPTAWTILDHQLEYADIWAMPGFWLLGFYELDRAVKKVRTYDLQELEEMVLQREAYIIKWSWMNQYAPHRCRGKTNFSQWDNTFLYPKFKDIPKITKTMQMEKGLVHLTEGVPDYFFNFHP